VQKVLFILSEACKLCLHLLLANNTGLPDLYAMLDMLLPNDTAAVQELLSDVAAGLVWQRVLAVPQPLVCSLVSLTESAYVLQCFFKWQSVAFLPFYVAFGCYTATPGSLSLTTLCSQVVMGNFAGDYHI